ncbi:MAG: hypothetical protein HYX78_05575 [Armatimonadetes bacterium]|nr:hypothetical protein [Armatimonadota bacterium]
MDVTDAIYRNRLADVLRRRDTGVLRDFLKEEAAARDPSRVGEIEMIPDDVLESRMYKMILARPDLGDIHAEARRWLREHDQRI